MARARNIKPGFYKNEDLAECSPWARLLFPGLWMLADREGRMEDRPKRIKGEIFPFDSIEVGPLLDELERWGFILRYKKKGASYLQILKFTTHQTPHYTEKESVIPAHDFLESSPDDDDETPGALHEDSKKQPLIKRGSLPPDSLNPDSLNPDSLNPDSLNPESGEQAAASNRPPPREEPPAAAAPPGPLRAVDPIHVRSCEMTALLAPRGCKLNATNPHVRSWAERAVTDAQLLTAFDIAESRRAEKGDASAINAGYLNAIVSDLLGQSAGPPARASPVTSADRLREQNRVAMAEAKAAILAREQQHASG